MNKGLKPRAVDPRAVFDPAHHDSHKTMGGLARCPDLKQLLENAKSPVMQRNAVIALANIGSRKAADLLRQCKGIVAGRNNEYLAWAIARLTKQAKK